MARESSKGGRGRKSRGSQSKKSREKKTKQEMPVEPMNRDRDMWDY